jgi:hypothetical protein
MSSVDDASDEISEKKFFVSWNVSSGIWSKKVEVLKILPTKSMSDESSRTKIGIKKSEKRTSTPRPIRYKDTTVTGRGILLFSSLFTICSVKEVITTEVKRIKMTDLS